MDIIFKLISYDDLLRFLINLAAWNSDCMGTFFIKQCSQTKEILDLTSPYFIRWEHLTAQSPFFLFHNYFGTPGIFLTFFLIYLLYRKIKNHKNFGFILFTILFQFFIQKVFIKSIFLLDYVCERR